MYRLFREKSSLGSSSSCFESVNGSSTTLDDNMFELHWNTDAEHSIRKSTNSLPHFEYFHFLAVVFGINPTRRNHLLCRCSEVSIQPSIRNTLHGVDLQSALAPRRKTYCHAPTHLVPDSHLLHGVYRDGFARFTTVKTSRTLSPASRHEIFSTLSNHQNSRFTCSRLTRPSPRYQP
jgi:hypothetical protein